ncbi:hypothetical protein [Embleya sp. NBC_00896]|uniref:hypothetical protein n=1 Tax=Embleya sp. NBC_00896 TaxID=2975961 RepID=UPI0038666B6C|nr:hypothetical protein OG928_32200 [Embleya sp. NBC_00896]
MLVSPGRRTLQRVLQALRAHDADICDVLAVPQVNDNAQELRAAPGPAEDVEGEDQAQGDVAGGEEGGERSEWRPILRFSTQREPVEIARFVDLRVVDPQSRNWLRGCTAAERYLRAHGNLAVPLDAVDIDHHGVKFPPADGSPKCAPYTRKDTSTRNKSESWTRSA